MMHPAAATALMLVLIGAAGRAPAGLRAAPVPAAIADSASLTVVVGSSLTHDDNIYLDTQAPRADTVLTVSPGVTLALRDHATLHGSLSLQRSFVSYLGGTVDRYQLGSVQAAAGVTGARSQLDFAASRAESRGNTRDFRDAQELPRREQTSLSLDGTYRLSEKTSLQGGASFSREDSAAAAFFATRDWSIPLAISYLVSPRTSLNANYRYNRTEVARLVGRDFQDHAIGWGMSGEVTPKVSGHMGLNWTRQIRSAGGGEDLLGFDGSLSWAAAPKLTANATFTRSFRTSRATGESFVDTGVAISADFRIADFWSAQANVDYANADYASGRRDQLLVSGGTLSYAPALPVTFALRYARTRNYSNVPLAAYTAHTISLSASVRY